MSFSTAAGILEGGERVGAEERAGLVAQHLALAVDVDLAELARQAEGLLEDLRAAAWSRAR